MSKSATDSSIYKEYFQHTKNYQSQYGERTVVLMQVGAFFEVYGIKNEAGTIIEVSTPDSIQDNYRVLPGDSQTTRA
jgi:hypothetical protein